MLTDAYGSLSKALKGFEQVAINTKRSGTKAHHLYPAVSHVQAQLSVGCTAPTRARSAGST